MNNFRQKVYSAVKKIPKGKVSTYSQIAKTIGHKKAWRVVGNVLSKNPYKRVPCHRVIRSDGKIGGYSKGIKEKIKILRKEGIEINKNLKIKSKKYFW